MLSAPLQDCDDEVAKRMDDAACLMLSATPLGICRA